MRIDAHQHFWRIAVATTLAARRPGARAAAARLRADPLRVAARAARRRADRAGAGGADDGRDRLPARPGGAHAVDRRRGRLGRPAPTPTSVATLERWARNPKFKGVRPMLQDLPDPRLDRHRTAAGVVRRDRTPRPALRRAGAAPAPAARCWRSRSATRSCRWSSTTPPSRSCAGLAAHWAAPGARTSPRSRASRRSAARSRACSPRSPTAAPAWRQQLDAVRPVWDHAAATASARAA